jgi:hypothetical protein
MQTAWCPPQWSSGPRDLNYLTWWTVNDSKTGECIKEYDERLTTNERFTRVEDFMSWLLKASYAAKGQHIAKGRVRVAYEVPVDFKADPHQHLLQPYNHRFELRDNEVPWHEYEDYSPVRWQECDYEIKNE